MEKRRPNCGLSVFKDSLRKMGMDVLAGPVEIAGDNGFKLKNYLFRLDMRKKFLILRVLTDWHGLPKEKVGVTSSRSGWNEVLSNLV